MNNVDQVEALKKSYLSTFNSESGKKVLKDLERRCWSKATTFNENTCRLAFNEGQRSIYLHINSMMNLDIVKMRKLQEEEDKKPVS